MGRKWSLNFAQLIKSALRLWRNPELRGPSSFTLPTAAEQSKHSVLFSCALSSRSCTSPPSPTCAVLGRKGGIIKNGGDAEIIKNGVALSPLGQQWVQQWAQGAAMPLRSWEEPHKQKHQLFIQYIFSTLRKLGKGRRLTYLPVWEEQCSREERLSPEQLWDMRAGSDLPIRVKKWSFPFWSKPNEHLTEQFEANS